MPGRADPVKPARKPPGLARTRILVSLAGGFLLALPVAAITRWEFLPLIGWDFTAAIFMLWVWLRIWPLDAGGTARVAAREDPTRADADLIALVAAVASFGAVGVVLTRAANSSGAEQVLLALLGVVSLVLSWAVVHTVYTLRYARAYYAPPEGGIDFKGEPPRYSDFAYVAFGIGMTFQIADTDLHDHRIRKLVLAHSLLSFLFAAGILAAAVNVIASLGG